MAAFFAYICLSTTDAREIGNLTLAITALEYLVFAQLHKSGVFSSKPRVLEMGESNWYGDVSTGQLAGDIDKLVTDPAARSALQSALREALAKQTTPRLYDLARIFFRTFLDFSEYCAIDPGTPGSRLRFDLNQPVPISDEFDVTINIGTAEHIFNVHQFFKTCHERTKPGGLMIHSSPFTGWRNHGFFNFQPTFFYDLARANEYHILVCGCGQIEPLRYVQFKSQDDVAALLKSGAIPENSHINAVFRKPPHEKEFAIPIQGYYAGVLSPESVKAWHLLR